MKITFLGTGTSSGIPMIGCPCAVCQSTDAKDKRLRCSILVQTEGLNIVVDAGPDFRMQMLNAQLDRLDALLLTHGHRDHIGGLDDIRPFNHFSKKPTPVYLDEIAEQMVREQFGYVFKISDYPYMPKLSFQRINAEPFMVENVPIIPIEVMHHLLPIKAFRFGDFTYVTDAKTISEKEKEKIRGTKILVVNALRREPHISHFTLDEALAFVEEIKPEQTYLTHIAHQLGKHADVNPTLPAGVQLAYDGLVI